ncbi:hypothetical protein JAAARDRAFT_47486 [Jaapia argillacea MUCL 33604]|uniref:Uncharacterized protein n=1 Tax=Jaapia argillacea MUCL 33604 TaxID=933084 RepID=A0A067PRW0_9AGAM|nr:hypothetical protein JAAARDRAFT_47486 [Jaapia argillacea MUCL 33604]
MLDLAWMDLQTAVLLFHIRMGRSYENAVQSLQHVIEVAVGHAIVPSEIERDISLGTLSLYVEEMCRWMDTRPTTSQSSMSVLDTPMAVTPAISVRLYHTVSTSLDSTLPLSQPPTCNPPSMPKIAVSGCMVKSRAVLSSTADTMAIIRDSLNRPASVAQTSHIEPSLDMVLSLMSIEDLRERPSWWSTISSQADSKGPQPWPSLSSSWDSSTSISLRQSSRDLKSEATTFSQVLENSQIYVTKDSGGSTDFVSDAIPNVERLLLILVNCHANGLTFGNEGVVVVMAMLQEPQAMSPVALSDLLPSRSMGHVPATPISLLMWGSSCSGFNCSATDLLLLSWSHPPTCFHNHIHSRLGTTYRYALHGRCSKAHGTLEVLYWQSGYISKLARLWSFHPRPLPAIPVLKDPDKQVFVCFDLQEWGGRSDEIIIAYLPSAVGFVTWAIIDSDLQEYNKSNLHGDEALDVSLGGTSQSIFEGSSQTRFNGLNIEGHDKGFLLSLGEPKGSQAPGQSEDFFESIHTPSPVDLICIFVPHAQISSSACYADEMAITQQTVVAAKLLSPQLAAPFQSTSFIPITLGTLQNGLSGSKILTTVNPPPLRSSSHIPEPLCCSIDTQTSYQFDHNSSWFYFSIRASTIWILKGILGAGALGTTPLTGTSRRLGFLKVLESVGETQYFGTMCFIDVRLSIQQSNLDSSNLAPPPSPSQFFADSLHVLNSPSIVDKPLCQLALSSDQQLTLSTSKLLGPDKLGDVTSSTACTREGSNFGGRNEKTGVHHDGMAPGTDPSYDWQDLCKAWPRLSSTLPACLVQPKN